MGTNTVQNRGVDVTANSLATDVQQCACLLDVLEFDCQKKTACVFACCGMEFTDADFGLQTEWGTVGLSNSLILIPL